MSIRTAGRLACLPLLSVLLLVATGCPPLPNGASRCVAIGTDGDTPQSSSQPFIWIGTADAGASNPPAYRAIQAGETLPVQYGPQGGEHIWGAVRLYAPAGGTWTLRFQIKGPDGALVAAFEVLLDSCMKQLAEKADVTVRFEVDPASVTTGTMSVDGSPDGGKTTVHAEAPIAWK